MQILQHHYRYFKITIVPRRPILEAGGEKPDEIVTEKQQQTLTPRTSSDSLDQQTRELGKTSLDAALKELKQNEAIMLDSKKESKTKPDEIGQLIDEKITKLIEQKAVLEKFIAEMQSFITGLTFTKIMNIDKKDRKNYERVVKIGEKNIRIFIEHNGAAIKYGVNEV